MISVRTDLAIEAADIYKKENNKDADGITIKEINKENNKITIVKILNESGSEKIGKPIGNYITMEIPEFTAYDGKMMSNSSEVLGKVLKDFLKIQKKDTVLVVGLGNIRVTPDALGPKVVENIMVQGI